MAREMGGADKVQAPARRRPAHGARAHRRAGRSRAASTRSAPSPARPSTTRTASSPSSRPPTASWAAPAIDGRPVVVLGDDFTVRGGSADATIPKKPIMAERMANELRLPIIRIIEGSGGGGSVKTIETTGRANLPGQLGISQLHYQYLADNLGTVPVVALGLGSVAGLGAARLAASHYSVMTKATSAMFVAGPPVVARIGQDLEQAGARRLGGAVPGRRRRPRRRHRGGSLPVRAPLPVLPAVLGLRRAGRAASAPIRPTGARRCCSRSSRATGASVYKMRPIIDAVVDKGSFFEMGQHVRPPDHHRPRAARRAARRHHGQRPLPLRRRLDGGCLRQDRALRRPGRDLPSAGRLPRATARAS